jgi:hypothetical protein
MKYLYLEFVPLVLTSLLGHHAEYAVLRRRVLAQPERVGMDLGGSSSEGDTPLSLVMQFLHESGYDVALKALEAERYQGVLIL